VSLDMFEVRMRNTVSGLLERDHKICRQRSIVCLCLGEENHQQTTLEVLYDHLLYYSHYC
jgi:hypothetical protein